MILIFYPSTAPSPHRFHLSGQSVTLALAETLTITGQRVRLLAYLRSNSPPQGDDIVFIAVQRSSGLRPQLSIPLQRILDYLKLDHGDIIGNAPGMREMLRCVASFLRFTYPADGGPLQLCLPYVSIKLASPKMMG